MAGKAKPTTASTRRAPTSATKAKGATRASKPRPPSAKVTSAADAAATPAAELIDRRIVELGGWRGETLARMRKLIREADPAVTEEWKWGNPVWSHDGIICTGEAYKAAVKLTFARGASLADPSRLFNASLEGNTRRAIDLPEGARVDAGAFTGLVKAAVALNGLTAKKR